MEKSIINFKEVGFRAQSKSEIYRALVTEGKLYLPPIKEKSILFIIQLVVSKKGNIFIVFFFINPFVQALKANQVEVCVLPHVKGLRSKELFEFLINYWNGKNICLMIILSTFPTEAGSQIYVWFVFLIPLIGNSLQRAKFQALISSRLLEREQHLLDSQIMTMEVDREFASIFQNSKIVSGKLADFLNWIRAKETFTSTLKESSFKE